MARTFEINGKKYEAIPFDFNLVCDLEDKGFSLDDFDNKTMSAIRAYLAICAGTDIRTAGKEIENHIIQGGKLSELHEVMGAELTESGFFKSISAEQEPQNVVELQDHQKPKSTATKPKK